MIRTDLKLLYRSFDETLTAEEQQRLERALEQSPELRQQKEHLLSLRSEISEVRFPAGKPFLAERILRRISATAEIERIEERFWEILFHTFQRVAIVAAIALVVLTCFHLLQSDAVSSTDDVVLEDIIEYDPYQVIGMTQ